MKKFYTIKVKGSYVNYYSEEVDCFLTEADTNSGNLLLMSEDQKNDAIQIISYDGISVDDIEVEEISLVINFK
jgi:hypothetical protein